MVEAINIQPGSGPGCPCDRCRSPWREVKFANGDLQRAGICEDLKEIIVVGSGYIPQECPRAEELPNAMVDTQRVVWEGDVCISRGVSG
jgi:hypothetical protein